MGDDRFAMQAFHLQFRDNAVETAYREETLQRTLLFCRIAWLLTVGLLSVFVLLDRSSFGDNASVVSTIRGLVVLIALAIFGATFRLRLRPWLVYSSALMLLINGSFSTLMVAMDDRTVMSPYFTGQIFVFVGIYSTVGLGFRYSFYSMLLTSGVLLFTVGLLAPVSNELLITYAFFITGAVMVFAYTAYITERVSRDRFATAEQLRISGKEVKKLSGMLPICASCKKVRDDKGYWSQIESYISDRSEAIFSHGVCPDCAEKLYPDFADEVTRDSEID